MARLIPCGLLLAGCLLAGCSAGPDPRTAAVVDEVDRSAALLWYSRTPVVATGTWLGPDHLVTTRHGTDHGRDPSTEVVRTWRVAQGGACPCPVVAGGDGRPLPTTEQTTTRGEMLEHCRSDWMILQMPPSETMEARPVPCRGEVQIGDEVLVGGWVLDPRSTAPGSPVPASKRRTTSGRVTDLHEGGVFSFEIEHGDDLEGGMSGGPIFVLRDDGPALAGIYLGYWVESATGLFPRSTTTQMGLSIPWDSIPQRTDPVADAGGRPVPWVPFAPVLRRPNHPRHGPVGHDPIAITGFAAAGPT
ncbi:MAG: hypothetical protein VX726_12275 [Planctomycetota bacterium]|nr:hypothetical protein [Planctomycetota bacterium]